MKTKKKTVSRRQYLRIKARLEHCRLNYNGEIERTNEFRKVVRLKNDEINQLWKERAAAVERVEILLDDVTHAQRRILEQSRNIANLRAERAQLIAAIKGLNMVIEEMRTTASQAPAGPEVINDQGINSGKRAIPKDIVMTPLKSTAGTQPNQPPFALPICA